MKELVKAVFFGGIIAAYIWVVRRMGREIDEADWGDLV